MNPTDVNLISLTWNTVTSTFAFSINAWVAVAMVALFVSITILRLWIGGFSLRTFEIDQAEIGVGTNKFRFKPNQSDRQVAYAIWVELSTRKVGLPIDFEHDVIVEVYDSWYSFFGVTRELVKSIPVSQVKRGSTQAIIKLSIEVLNEGLRPHLTRWQARFRDWYKRELKRREDAQNVPILDPQQIQAAFPQYELLKADMERVNQALIRYRAKMRELVMSE